MSKPTKTDFVFHALSNRLRRKMMDVVKLHPGCSVNELCDHFEISRIGVMKHLNILVEAKLVLSRKRGRTRELFFNAAPIQMIYDRWTDQYSAFWVTQAVDLKYQVEGKLKKKPTNKKKRPETAPAKTPSNKKPTTTKRKSKVTP